jgi:hypothetical protein
MFDPNTLLLLAALAARPDSAARTPTATDSVLASVVAPLIQPGNPMRVRTRFGVTEGFAGPVDLAGLALKHESVDIWSRPRVEPIAWSEIDRIDLRAHPSATGVKAGAVVGCLLGLASVMSIAAYAEPYGDSGFGGTTIVLGGAVGALIGGAVGALFDVGQPAWKTIYERR